MPLANERIVDETHETSIKPWGTSQGVRIPKSMCRTTGFLPGVPLALEAGEDDFGPYILLRASDPRHRSFSNSRAISMDEAFKGYGGSYRPEEADWGADLGAEEIE